MKDKEGEAYRTKNSNIGPFSAATHKLGVREKRGQKRTMHPCNKYAERPPDFELLAAKYRSFREYVTIGSNKKPRIDWKDFNATRELTRVLLEHDYGIKWWIPDGQLCPTVPNRANYIHWIGDLLSVSPAPWHAENPSQIRGVDIGTGANCIYPLLGASLNGWHFVATDVTPTALEWAQRNVEDNPQFMGYIEIRRGGANDKESRMIPPPAVTRPQNLSISFSEDEVQLKIQRDHSSPILQSKQDCTICEAATISQTGANEVSHEAKQEPAGPNNKPVLLDESDRWSREEDPLVTDEDVDRSPRNEPLLVSVIKAGENYDFCMCNPPFFERIEEAGLNPRTACGGTLREMVYPGGELAFISQIINDSLQLRSRIQWYTSLVGRKANIKLLSAKLRDSGVTMLRTTEFVQGRTSRWGIAWSFSPAQSQVTNVPGRVLEKSNISFMLEGVGRTWSAWDVYQALDAQLRACGAKLTLDTPSFTLTGTVSTEMVEPSTVTYLPSETKQQEETDMKSIVTKSQSPVSFRASVFQQVPGTLLIKASLPKNQGPSDTFSLLFERVELALRKQFLKTPVRT